MRAEVLNRIYIPSWAKKVVHEDTYLVQIVQDTRIAVLGEMVTNIPQGWVYGRYTIGAKDKRGGISKSGVRNPDTIYEGCSVMNATLQSEWANAGHNLKYRLDKAQERAEEGGEIEDLDILHPINPVKVRDGSEDYRPTFINEEAAEVASALSVYHLGLAPARLLRGIVADALVIQVPMARAVWKWYDVEDFDDYDCSRCRHPRYAYQQLLAACRDLHKEDGAAV